MNCRERDIRHMLLLAKTLRVPALRQVAFLVYAHGLEDQILCIHVACMK